MPRKRSCSPSQTEGSCTELVRREVDFRGVFFLFELRDEVERGERFFGLDEVDFGLVAMLPVYHRKGVCILKNDW